MAEVTSTQPATVPTSSATALPAPSDTLPPTAASPEGTATVSPERIADAQALADQWLAGDDEAIFARFDDTMKTAFPLDQVKQAREGLLAQAGSLERQIGARAVKSEQYDIVYVTYELEKGDVDVKMVFNQAGQIAGLFFQNAGSENASAYEAPAYVDTTRFAEQEVTVGTGEWALPGTLSLPVGDGPFPALVLVHGSGPNDRDETIGPNKPFRDLAWGLATRGIAVLRYEKRTREHASKFTPELVGALTVQEETVDDALAAVALLRETHEIDPARVYVLGHSLGGYVLPRIGAADPLIAGLVFLAGFTRPLEDLVLEQVTYIAGVDGTISPDEQTTIDQLKAQVARAKDPALSPSTPASELPLNTPAGYLLDLRDYDPTATAKGLMQRMLIVQGARDYQVTTVDFEGWKAALGSRPDVEFELYPDLNHLFMTGEGKSTPEEYMAAGHVAEPVIARIVAWVLE
ncbi:MAG TPA: alpha/beta fold hydrolase [Anaerolineae bacterium]|nr:alpha/beta fold hydrolase [Anaerolineae bacterium]